MSSRSKGMMYERKAQLELEADGYLVHRVPGSSKWNKNVDMFGLFDMMSLKKIWKNDKLYHIERRWIQVKTNKKLSKKELEPFGEFRKQFCDAHDTIEIWSFWQQGKRKKKKGWEINVI